MPRGGARPGAGRPTKEGDETKRRVTKLYDCLQCGRRRVQHTADLLGGLADLATAAADSADGASGDAGSVQFAFVPSAKPGYEVKTSPFPPAPGELPPRLPGRPGRLPKFPAGPSKLAIGFVIIFASPIALRELSERLKVAEALIVAPLRLITTAINTTTQVKDEDQCCRQAQLRNPDGPA